MPGELYTEELLADLKWLRKGRGFTASRIYNTLVLLDYLGGENLDFETLKWRFVFAIHSISDKNLANKCTIKK